MLTPRNTIPECQNADPQVDLLAAASHAYGRAKGLMALQFTLTVPAALMSALLMAWQPTWKLWMTVFSISVALVDTLCLSRSQARWKQRGAVLQQRFDSAVFQLPWQPLRYGPPVASEEVFAQAQDYLRKAKDRRCLLNWYPVAVQAIPLPYARLICQRASLWWDLRQRDRVRGTLTATLALLMMTVFLIALVRHNTVEEMILTVYVPLAPAILWIIREILGERDAIEADERALAAVEAHWKLALAHPQEDGPALTHSLLIQEALFDARSRSPLVFNWVYALLRKRKQEQMEHKAQELVNEALARLEGTSR